MAKLSEHFSEEEFKCRCPACRGEEFRIHLGLIGALEMMAVHFGRKPEVVSGYFCETYYDSLKRNRRSYHTMGKAAHIRIEGVPASEIFKFAETIPELNGIGLYVKDNAVHLDTRPAEKRELWVKEGESYSPMTSDKRLRHGL